jgi:MFS family permease
VTPTSLAGSDSLTAASTVEARGAYVDQAVIGYLLYGVGAVTAFLAAALSLSDAEAALHSSLMAIGFIVAGFAGDRLDGRLGTRGTNIWSYLLLSIAALCLASALTFPVTLAGAGLVGTGAGLLLAHVNGTLTRGGGALARVRMGRAALVAMGASLSVPLAIGIGAWSGLGWQLALAVAGLLIAAGLWSAIRRSGSPTAASWRPGSLPARYWLAWWLIVLSVSVEFSIVFWASTLVQRQVHITLADATIVAAAFYAGMASARIALSLHLVGEREPLAIVRVSLVVAVIGSLLAWAGSDVAVAGLGIYLGGLGTGFLYPLGVSVALAMVPELRHRASARLILASGLAILVAPLALGALADASGVTTAWLLIPTLCLAALGLTLPVARSLSG